MEKYGVEKENWSSKNAIKVENTGSQMKLSTGHVLEGVSVNFRGDASFFKRKSNILTKLTENANISSLRGGEGANSNSHEYLLSFMQHYHIE